MRNKLYIVLVSCLLFVSCASSGTGRSVGWTRIALRDHQGALTFFEEALKSSQAADLHAGRARSLFMLGRIGEARLGYVEALAIEPNNPEWHVGLAIVQLASGEITAATASCDAAIELNPRLAKAYYNRGCAQLQAQAYDVALTDFSQSIRLEPQHAASYNCRGVVLANTGRLEAAIEDFRRAAYLSPMASAHGNCAAAYYAQGQTELALTELNLAIRLERMNPVHYESRGRIYLDLGHANLAASDFEEALSRAPHALEYQLLLAQANELKAKRAPAAPESSLGAVQSASYGD